MPCLVVEFDVWQWPSYADIQNIAAYTNICNEKDLPVVNVLRKKIAYKI